jgi:site-specific DNA-methyltransferase (adenine-specific)
MPTPSPENRIKSYGEVYTQEKEVNNMLDLVADFSLRFFEPGCGSGNFLIELLHRKVSAGLTVSDALSTLYGIDILEDNITHTRQRLLDAAIQYGLSNDAATAIIEKNIFIQDFLDPTFKPDVDFFVGNPPYQRMDGGHGASSTPLYHLFINKIKALAARYMLFIIPSRWMVSGKGLDTFRKDMLNDDHLKILVDHPVSVDCFPDVDITGGVCYFLWDREYTGLTDYRIKNKDTIIESRLRKLNDFDILIRHKAYQDILEQVLSHELPSFSKNILGLNPFGFSTNYFGSPISNEQSNMLLYARNRINYIHKDEIKRNTHLIPRYKVMQPKASGYGTGILPTVITGLPFVAKPDEVCTQTYVVCYTCDDFETAYRVGQYLATKFVRFMIFLRKNTQDFNQSKALFVPEMDFSLTWTDENLYSHFNLSQEFIAIIEAHIKPLMYTGVNRNL